MYKLLSDMSTKIEAVLRDRGASCTVVGGKVLPAYVDLRLIPNKGVRIASVSRLVRDISLTVGVPDVRVSVEGNYISIQIPRKNPEVTRLSVLMDMLQDDPPHYTCVLGLNSDARVMMATISSPEIAHIGVFGATGSGKTNLIRCIVGSMCVYHRPSALGVVMLDAKQRAHDSAFDHLIYRHLLKPPTHDIDTAMQVLTQVVNAMQSRVISSAQKHYPRILVVVDELMDLCLQNKNFALLVSRIAQRGREAGVHLIVGTQKPTAKELGSLLKVNLPLRIVGRVSSPEDAKVATGISNTGAERLSRSGMFLAVCGGRVTRFTAPLFDLQPPQVPPDTPLTNHANHTTAEVADNDDYEADTLTTAPQNQTIESTRSQHVSIALAKLDNEIEASKNKIALAITDGRKSYAGTSFVKYVDSVIDEAEQLLIQKWRLMVSESKLDINDDNALITVVNKNLSGPRGQRLANQVRRGSTTSTTI